jgi:hypothetical protein
MTLREACVLYWTIDRLFIRSSGDNSVFLGGDSGGLLYYDSSLRRSGEVSYDALNRASTLLEIRRTATLS